MEAVFPILAAVVAVIAFELLALRFGANSRDGRAETWW